MLEFTCPMDCLAGVGEVWSGQYALPAGSRVTGTPVILDIGANCGAFTLWAKLHWPGAPITAYEPQPDIFNYLAANVGSLPGVAIHCAAVGDPARPFLHPGSDSSDRAPHEPVVHCEPPARPEPSRGCLLNGC